VNGPTVSLNVCADLSDQLEDVVHSNDFVSSFHAVEKTSIVISERCNESRPQLKTMACDANRLVVIEVVATHESKAQGLETLPHQNVVELKVPTRIQYAQMNSPIFLCML
jgi:hypothetical protein